ncbi:MAG TPA: T9SS type A sorting domain-containing protein [Ignavibacteriaceae bacterium]|jgi:hypothetical protein|nr:MAG: hypothetical protein BWY38_00059 [Ignavibacteria bacterium ADurb.Bin266]OQY70719.1 MAG: hypothetical protein B6D44_14795 [Ignavibacteriales bacterium UTCHB2]HQF42866.1 T9SS type A sorting domain-containing protein [Ignavibacteriaceae bacterium]HQI42109.1 T9SS type A sorting domain-containing protein [Ignavibacteriaceae bacterium]
MKKILYLFIVLLLGAIPYYSTLAQEDQIEGQNFQFQVPEHIQSLQQQIKLAEDNEDWDLYYSLRPKLITAWNDAKPEIANLYRNTNNAEQDNINTEAPKFTTPYSSQIQSPLWGNDIIVHSGSVLDMSLVVSRNDTLYLGVLESSGTAVNIYASGNGGSTWSLFRSGFSVQASKIELIDFDGFHGSSGPSYLLLFTLYNNGTLWCTRFETGSSSYTNSKVVNSGCTDFSIDRTYSAANYRCFVLYDSTGTQFHKRSDPASYATIWQDPREIFNCKDPDIAYGLDGSLYLTYVGRSSGNLYQFNNYNYGDPASFINQRTVETGSTDTTFTPEIIATRQDTSQQTVMMVYTILNNGRNDLRTSFKTGGSGWSVPANWSTYSNTDNKLVNLFCKKQSSNTIFQASFTRTGLGNTTPRAIRYRKFSSGNWNSSIQVSDESRNVTGLQESNVVELSTGTAVFAYVGSNSLNVYFDNSSWVTDVKPETGIPEVYSLSQNYPNPFNPSTAIRFSIPEQTNVSLKIFNSIGQEVASLVNGELSAGNHEVNFNASKLSSGIYFYRIETPAFTSTKKMILIK